MSKIPENPETLLSREDTAEALTELGFRTAKATLATLACRGGGPPFHLFGRAPVYRWRTSKEWAESKLTAVRHTTSDGDAGRRVAA